MKRREKIEKCRARNVTKISHDNFVAAVSLFSAELQVKVKIHGAYE